VRPPARRAPGASTGFVTPKTVSSHIEHVYLKLGVSSRAAATHFAMRHGLVGSFEAAPQPHGQGRVNTR